MNEDLGGARKVEAASAFGFEDAASFAGGGRVFWHPPALNSARILVLSSRASFFIGHYVGGKMRECTGQDNCRYHRENIGEQARYMISVMSLDHDRPLIWEFSAVVAEQIGQIVKKKGQLRGLYLEVSRLGTNNRCRLGVEFVAASLEEDELAEPLDCLTVFRQNELD